jgi:hypothetical protein
VRDAVPPIFQTREFAVAGGLASYGTSTTEQYRAVAALGITLPITMLGCADEVIE